ncbi:MAG: Succinate--CoA ligase [ADP-forming] subunit beta [Verrucomicrobia subdivision 3 bacterium]|nr:Succinate--CoA ligase [ADP-forming] subunit beta [Limisphaerales bacterium]MCS1414461.1 Succinate--CoA ligase [ADP-forming] subunit beta [Limisphaerales bacterium]
MNIHEFQAKQLLAARGVTVPAEEPCKSVEEAKSVAERLLADGAVLLVLKAQIHAGGRGKGTFKSGFQGGVHLCKSADEVVEKAEAMLGEFLVTKQTGEAGRQVNALLVAAAEKILKEFYLAVLLDRKKGCPLVMVSTEGGMDIEEVAEKTPEKIIRETINPAFGMNSYQARKVAVGLAVPPNLIGAAAKLIQNVYRTYWDTDASLVEINPLCLVEDGEGKQNISAVDAKISIDDNALYRHKDIAAMRDLGEESPLEIEASKFDLNYIKLDGNIACLVNGAGLAMATMDIIKYFGGNPANFLDVGGGASKEQVTAAFQIILSDLNVRGILVNIFGGIMQCDVIAEGIVAAARETQLALPLVVRLEGNSVEIGKRILAESGLTIINGESMADAAEKIVAAAGKAV